MRKPSSFFVIVAVVAVTAVATAAAYRIQPGDTLSQIAAEHDTTVRALVDANGIADPDLIYAGDSLTIPGRRPLPKPQGAAGPAPAGVYDHVKPGQLSAVGIGECLLDAGFPRGDLQYWIAVGLAESSGLTGVHGDVNIQTGKWGPSVGVFQVRTLWADRGTGRWRDIDRLTDPAFNCSAAYVISDQATTSYPWGAGRHHDGRYAQFMGQAGEAAARL